MDIFRQMVLLVVLTGCILLPTSSLQAQAKNLLYNGDLEQAGSASPPSGWVMWGTEKDKIAGNFTSDTTRRHSGRAGLRLHHEAGASAYLLSAPETAIRPKTGMMYTLSFWACADKPLTAAFGWEAFESIKPFVNGTGLERASLELTTEWQQFKLEIHEGNDFFADRCKFITMVIIPYIEKDHARECILWVDDVVIQERKSTRRGRLINPETLKRPALPHRLTPGTQLSLTVDARQKIQKAARDAGGISFYRVQSWMGYPFNYKGQYTLVPQLEQAIRELKLPMTRFYAVGDEPFSVENSIDKISDLCKRMDIAEDHTVLELENQSAESKLDPEIWAKAARHVQTKGYKFRHWEVANEPFNRVWGGQSIFTSSKDYVSHVKNVSAAIREVAPKSQIGVAILAQNQSWGNAVLKEASGSYDFVAGHHYSHTSQYEGRFEDTVLTDNFRMLADIGRVNALIDAYNKPGLVYQYDTEWGAHGGGRNGEPAAGAFRNGNICGAMHRAVRMIYYTRERTVAGASTWCMFNQPPGGMGFMILSQTTPDTRYLMYWLYYHFNRHVGDSVLQISGTAPYWPETTPPSVAVKTRNQPPTAAPVTGPLTPVLATLSEDGKKLFLIVVNGSWDRSIECRVNLRNFTPTQVTALALSQADRDASPAVERPEDVLTSIPVESAQQSLKCSLPPHSIVFLTAECP